MIISQIIGGLGNQMFQYAAARSLSVERNQPLRLNIAEFDGYGLHQGFELERVFNCPAEIATKAEVGSILGWQFFSVIRRVLARPGMAALRRDGFVVEPHFHYWPEINRIPKDCYLVGYWQSERYFEKHASEIRADFAFKLPLSDRNSILSEQISQVNAVSLHVRRGDYAKNSKTRARHGLCSPDYYQRAINYISGQVEQPRFFIFSDDMAWVKTHLKMAFPCYYVDHNRNEESYNDMHLMSLCRHHIIANSSFSWWGAWLNPAPDKIVVAPVKWFADKNNNKDLFPPGWVTL
ncbi:Glycosyl transferase family 11 [Candidatus Methylobacter favarea]|uniref:Glycosyl transferase family 11 n=1 Tax=Candidatus Methylobacter favarea TaxID=2707345 RepID=A0A8S0WB74_9GAMM|nr:alpha-1,2-fucosyltransferase [Candidatus Methylobacter favarea]CAA9891483.1 Glycosyl transferase family 11 [Candidatus Methylobacter favarea]